MRTAFVCRPILLLIALVTYVAAQSPNTASVIVVVVDQTGAGVKDAKVSVVNTATGAVRESVSGSDGSATIPALSLTGTYTVGVSKAGFGNEELKDIALRSGETATLTVKLLVGSGKAEVTVFGTAEGVRADAQIGRRLESPQIDETPILGRKVIYAAAAECGVPAGQGHRRSLRQPDLLRHRRGFAPHHHRHSRRREQR